MVAAIGASYATDVIFLTLFSIAGTIPFSVPVIFASAGAGHVIIFSLLHWTGFSDRFANPHLSIWQMLYAVAVQLLGIVLALSISAFFLGIIFIIFAFGSFRLTLKKVLLVWLIVCAAVGSVLLVFRGGSLVLMHPSLFESIIVWISFSFILLRCQFIGYYAMRLRLNLVSKNVAISKHAEHAQDLATHDALTNALNRRAILPLIEENIGLTKRKSIPCSVAIIDIDHFKLINDRHGHLLGDEVLKELVVAINASIRVSDKLSRYGGEEFVLLMPATTSQEAFQVVERMRTYVESKNWEFLGVTLSVTVSAGLASVDAEDDLTTLLSKADTALFQAKNWGRNRVVLSLK